MCGRFTLTTEPNILQDYFAFALPEELAASWEPRYNIAPTNRIWTVGPQPDGVLAAEVLRWGLTPHWAKALATVFINARAETVATKPAFRTAFKAHRIIVLADGYYEWQKRADGDGKQPHRIVSAEGHPLLMAGLRSDWRGAEGTVATAAIVTRPATAHLAAIHDRMPLILDPETARSWITGDPEEWAARLADPPESPPLRAYPVSPRVNRVGVDDPTLIEPTAS